MDIFNHNNFNYASGVASSTLIPGELSRPSPAYFTVCVNSHGKFSRPQFFFSFYFYFHYYLFMYFILQINLKLLMYKVQGEKKNDGNKLPSNYLSLANAKNKKKKKILNIFKTIKTSKESF